MVHPKVIFYFLLMTVAVAAVAAPTPWNSNLPRPLLNNLCSEVGPFTPLDHQKYPSAPRDAVMNTPNTFMYVPKGEQKEDVLVIVVDVDAADMGVDADVDSAGAVVVTAVLAAVGTATSPLSGLLLQSSSMQIRSAGLLSQWIRIMAGVAVASGIVAGAIEARRDAVDADLACLLIAAAATVTPLLVVPLCVVGLPNGLDLII